MYIQRTQFCTFRTLKFSQNVHIMYIQLTHFLDSQKKKKKKLTHFLKHVHNYVYSTYIIF